MKTIALIIGVAAMLLLAKRLRETGPSNAAGDRQCRRDFGKRPWQLESPGPVYTVSEAPAAYPNLPAKLLGSRVVLAQRFAPFC